MLDNAGFNFPVWDVSDIQFVVVNGKDVRRSSPLNVSCGLFKCFCSEPVLLLGNLFTHFTVTLDVQVRAVLSAPRSWVLSICCLVQCHNL